ncbi:MAG: C40 family peptidase, partial [Pseudomonadota bacterium]
VRTSDLQPKSSTETVVRAVRTYAKATPHLKTTEPEVRLSFGARLHTGRSEGDWVSTSVGNETLWVPRKHLGNRNAPFEDPAAVAELFLHTPYLWGGNTAFGIDCSGLVQAALLACGMPCPGDSDQQEARVGTALPDDAPLQRGDLIFWKGHVAMMLDPENNIHANAHHMAVAIEPFEVARKRIEVTGGGPVTSIRRT